ncbi:hypothetical protein BDR03DRAFT_1014441 [Suillus americanus]|nr:hypothetical protein BDR03DRAFT_1014441 [Suillus americanus]
MANVTTANDGPDTWTSVLNVFGDVVFVDIQNTISVNNTYCFNLNLDSPGPKKIVFRIRQQTNSQDSGSDSETESESEEEENGRNRVDAEMKTEDEEVGIDEVKVEDEDLVIGPDFQPVVASPCSLLTRCISNPHPDPKNPTVPWSYYVKKMTEVENQEEISVGDPAAL